MKLGLTRMNGQHRRTRKREAEPNAQNYQIYGKEPSSPSVVINVAKLSSQNSLGKSPGATPAQRCRCRQEMSDMLAYRTVVWRSRGWRCIRIWLPISLSERGSGLIQMKQVSHCGIWQETACGLSGSLLLSIHMCGSSPESEEGVA